MVNHIGMLSGETEPPIVSNFMQLSETVETTNHPRRSAVFARYFRDPLILFVVFLFGLGIGVCAYIALPHLFPHKAFPSEHRAVAEDNYLLF